jgi:hypothetical protein
MNFTLQRLFVKKSATISFVGLNLTDLLFDIMIFDVYVLRFFFNITTRRIFDCSLLSLKIGTMSVPRHLTPFSPNTPFIILDNVTSTGNQKTTRLLT